MIIDEKYRKLAEWIKDNRKDTDEWKTYSVLTDDYGEKVDDLVGYTTTAYELNSIMPMIHAIYTGDYEIKEVKYYWKFLPLAGDFGMPMFLSRLDNHKHRLSDTTSVFSEFTQSQFNDFIKHDDYLTADMFESERVEED